jgi:aspartate/methionine/tyrosine aminotransferase
VQPDDIATAPGATGALDQLFSVLGDAGDAVLIAAPQ